MPFFTSEQLSIAYEIYGTGRPVVLVHGFASNGVVNWVQTGWVETLNEAGYQAITMDNRGHGQSDKPYDPAVYGARDMARDVANLIAHLGIAPAAVMGYSMGARICAFTALEAPDAVACAVFGGLGINMVAGLSDSAEIVAALQAPDLASVTGKSGRMFRSFAESTKSDLSALAACMQSSRQIISREEVARISVPVLVAVGEADEIAGEPQALADLMPEGEAVTIPRRDHMRTTGDAQYKRATLEFLARHYAANGMA